MEYNYVKETLSYYNIPESEVILLRHNENMTFRIGKDYLLQIHKSIEGFQTQHIYKGMDRMAVYETELKFLLYLKKQGMIIREPIENCNGELITKLNNGIVATVSKWVEGESLDKLEVNSQHYYQIGAFIANLHKCAKGFQGFPVVTYDGQHCEYIKERIQKLEDSRLNHTYCKIMQKACDTVGISLLKVKNEFQMLHADLSLSNILTTKAGLAAIDFSFFGIGHPMFDIAILFGNIKNVNGLLCRQKIAKGYQDAGGIIHYKALDTCFVLSILGSIAIHFDQWSKQDWFEDRLKRWCKESFEPFCAEERLFADDYYLNHVGN